MDILENLSNFVFVLHKDPRQSLIVSPESPFDWKFLKVGSVIVYCFIKTVPNIQDCLHASAPPTELNIKSVYVINHSWYRQIIDPVCISAASLTTYMRDLILFKVHCLFATCV